MNIYARPNLNGNSPRDFRDAALKLHRGIEQIEEALRDIGANVVHGRNYQTVSSPDHSRDVDVAKLRTAFDRLEEYKALQFAIAKAAMKK